VDTYVFCPIHQLFFPFLNKSSDSNTKLVTPRVPLLDLHIRWKSGVFDCSSPVVFGLLFGFPTGKLLPMTTVLGEESLLSSIISLSLSVDNEFEFLKGLPRYPKKSLQP
jgi:hypothetical protein